MQYATDYDVTSISDTTTENMITMGKVDTSDLMMIMTWAINISFQSPELKWVSWTQTTPYILMTKVIERTSSMLDTHPQDKLYRRSQVLNACEHSCIMMMIMGGSKMSETEYDLKALCILPMTYPQNCVCVCGGITIPNHLDYHPIMQADPCVSSNAPSLGSSGELGHPLYDIVFSWGGRQFLRGTQALTQGSDHMLTEWGNTPTRHTSTEKYTSENIHARCQSSVGYLAW